MTYNHPTYDDIHPLHKEFADLEDRLGALFINYCNDLSIIDIKEKIKLLCNASIKIILHFSLEECRSLQFYKYSRANERSCCLEDKEINNMEKLLVVKQEKIAAVRAQNYIQAARLRDIENKLVEMINTGVYEPIVFEKSLFSDKILKTAIEICKNEIHVYIITAHEPYKEMIADIFN